MENKASIFPIHISRIDKKFNISVYQCEPKRLCGFGAVYMLKANLMLLFVVQYGDGIPVSDTDDFARELKGRGREG